MARHEAIPLTVTVSELKAALARLNSTPFGQAIGDDYSFRFLSYIDEIMGFDYSPRGFEMNGCQITLYFDNHDDLILFKLSHL